MGALAEIRLTEQQAAFARAVCSGHHPHDAVGIAGYGGEPKDIACRLLHTPTIALAIRSEINRLLVVEGLPLAYGVLAQIAKDLSAPPAVRRACARDLMDRAGIVPPKAQNAADSNEKPLSEMSSDELRGLVDRLEAELGARATDVSAPVNAPCPPKSLQFLE